MMRVFITGLAIIVGLLAVSGYVAMRNVVISEELGLPLYPQ